MSAGSLKGLGFVKVVSALPIHVGNLDAGATRTIRVVLDVPTVVTPLSLTEVGSFQNANGVKSLYVEPQIIVL